MNSWYNPPTRILIVDDDPDLLNVVSFTFHHAGYETVNVTTGSEALQAVERECFSLLVLDINMPPPNGLQVCAAVRRTSAVPVLMLSACDQEQAMLQALECGVDAYIVKPFSPRALIARAHALLRRNAPYEVIDQPIGETIYASSDRFKLDIDALLLRHPKGEIQLSRLEARVLRLLMLNHGRVVSTGDLISEVWSSYNAANRNMLKQMVFRLRRKLADNPDVLHSLKSNPGGYMWLDTPRIPEAVNVAS